MSTKRIAALLILIILLFTSCSFEQDVKKVSDQYRNFYEIFVRSFYDSDGDGLGDLNGVTEKLDYITEDLGADGIWLMPIMPSPSYHKYDVIDYYAIDPEYGTSEDFARLIEEAHKRDVKVIIDLVLNHTSNQNKWFTEAVNSLWSGEENAYTDFYNFSDEQQDGYSKITDKYYYECRFTTEMPDLNLDSPDVRAEILRITKFWIDQGVDGFRLDAVTSFYTGNDTKNTELLKWLNESVKEYKPDVYFVGEAWTNQSVIRGYYTSGIDSFFNFPFSQVSGDIVKYMNTETGQNLSAAVKSWNDSIKDVNPNAIDAPFLSNHDNARSAGFLLRSLQKQKLAASLYLLMPGNPFIYYGEEIGMTGSGVDPNKRLPMIWSTSDQTGITYTPPGSDQTITGVDGVDTQIKDESSLFNHYRAILAIKDKYPGIARGTMKPITTADPEILAYEMEYGNSRVYIFHNLKSTPLSVNLKELGLTKSKVSDYLLSGETQPPTVANGILELPQYSTVIIEMK